MDCIEGMKLIGDKTVDCIITDLPYNVTKNKWDIMIPFDELWKEYERIIKDNGAIILFGQGLFTAKLILSNEKLFRYTLVLETVIRNKEYYISFSLHSPFIVIY